MVRLMGNNGTEIRSFYSIKEMVDAIEEEIDQYRDVSEEYSQWLGSYLRDSGSVKGSGEKSLEALRKERLKTKAKKKKKKGKSKKKQASTDWIQFMEITLTTSEQGEAEILFNAIEEINQKIERLGMVRESVVQLEKSGFGTDLIYITYICDGIPERIVLRHRKNKDLDEKFKYIAQFSATQEV